MAGYLFKPQGVCSTLISFELDDQKRIHNLRYEKGCDGNLKALGVMTEGMPAREVMDKLRGVNCGNKGTSCADQLAQALDYVLTNDPAR
jgi:uncharacterized protein (TIGR03905 family)